MGASPGSPEQVATIRVLVMSCPWFYEVLDVVQDVGRQAGLDCWVGAGALRDLVWDTWYGPDPGRDPAAFDGSSVTDVDVAFFDADRLDAGLEAGIEAALDERRPDVTWDVKNQARVHLWYEDRFGTAVPPLTSVADAVATWPETATAVAVARTAAGTVDVIAPFGLGDLLNGVYRRNPRRVSVAEYQRRLQRKQPAVRWPGVRVRPG